MTTSTEDLIAAFLAKGGKVTKVETGLRAIESDRTIYAAMREGKLACADSVRAARDSEALYFRQRDAFDEGRYNGMSVADAHRQSQEVL